MLPLALGTRPWGDPIPLLTISLLPSPLCLQGSGLGPGTYSLPSSIEEGLRQAAGRVPPQVSGDKTKPSGGRRHDWEVRSPGTRRLDGVYQQAVALPPQTGQGMVESCFMPDPISVLLFGVCVKQSRAAAYGEQVGCRQSKGEQDCAHEQGQGSALKGWLQRLPADEPLTPLPCPGRGKAPSWALALPRVSWTSWCRRKTRRKAASAPCRGTRAAPRRGSSGPCSASARGMRSVAAGCPHPIPVGSACPDGATEPAWGCRGPGAAVQLSARRTKHQRSPFAQYAAGPGSYDPKPFEGSADFNQPPFWSSAKRFDRKSDRLFNGNEVSEQGTR